MSADVMHATVRTIRAIGSKAIHSIKARRYEDVAELTAAGDTLAIRAVEVISTAKSPSAIMSVAPASLYDVRLAIAGAVRFAWKERSYRRQKTAVVTLR